METLKKTGIIAGLLVAAGCSSLPDRVDSLEQARSAVRTTEQDPLADRVARNELANAREALQEADAAYRDKESLDYIEHKAYVAQRYVDISEQKIAEARAQDQISQGESQRERVVLQARAREAERAEQQARAAQSQLEQTQQALDEQQRQAQLAQERNEQLRQELSDLQAQETERGLVLTLGDVLFDTAQATLKAGAAGTIDRLAEFMREYPERHVLVEGYTDARGSEQFNQELSERRANAVREALQQRGIMGDRIRTAGLGEQYPVATNETMAGMQQNRRVEIVISDEQGQFEPGAERTVAVR